MNKQTTTHHQQEVTTNAASLVEMAIKIVDSTSEAVIEVNQRQKNIIDTFNKTKEKTEINLSKIESARKTTIEIINKHFNDKRDNLKSLISNARQHMQDQLIEAGLCKEEVPFVESTPIKVVDKAAKTVLNSLGSAFKYIKSGLEGSK